MARPLRIDSPGYWHHVMGRGIARQKVFLCDEDRLDFLDLLKECSIRWGVIIHAYVLMGNHYHVLVEDPEGCLSRAMRHLISVYTQRFNRRHRRDGALFRGRFRSKVIQAEEYAASVMQYIHQNPVKASMVAKAKNYRWSSASEASSTATRCLSSESLANLNASFGSNPIAYDPLDQSPVFGDDEFFIKCRGVTVAAPTKRTVNVPLGRALVSPKPEEIVRTVADYFEVQPREVVDAKSRRLKSVRCIAMSICVELCRFSACELGDYFGVQGSAIRSARRRCQMSADRCEDVHRIKLLVSERLKNTI